MLVLTRKQRQQISIGNNITITVLRVKGSTVRIGIEAPDGVRILRAELSAEEVEVLEGEPVASRAQQTSNNSRRSLSKFTGSDTENPLRDRMNSRQVQASASSVPLAGIRGVMPSMSILNVR